jgi:hypothetical protein
MMQKKFKTAAVIICGGSLYKGNLMKHKLYRLAIFLAACFSTTQAQAHVLLSPLPHHNIILTKLLPAKSTASSKLLTSLLTKNRNSLSALFGPGMYGSLSTRTLLLEEKTIATSAFTSGQNSVTASALLKAIPNSGQIEGTLYTSFANTANYHDEGVYDFNNFGSFVVNPNFGFVSPSGAAFTPGFVNSLSFTNTTFGNTSISSNLSKTISVRPSAKTGPLGLTGSAARLQKEFDDLAQKSFNAGVSASPFKGGTLAGGELTGTYYIENGSATKFRSVGNFVFAFGNNSLNNPSNPGHLVIGSSLPLTNYITFASGVTKDISSAQISGMLIGTGGGASQHGAFPFLFAIGNSPLNVGFHSTMVTSPSLFFTFF